jgi:hypothetical protein
VGLSAAECLARVARFIDEKAEEDWANYEIFLIDVGATGEQIETERARNSTEHVIRRRHALSKLCALVGDERGDGILQ